MAAPRQRGRAAVLAAGLLWLLQLLFPVIFVVAAPPPWTVVCAALLLGALLVAYVRAVLLIAREGAPRLCPVHHRVHPAAQQYPPAR
jgi:hypothetical protein